MERRPSPAVSWARGIQLSGGIRTNGWRGLGLRDGCNDSAPIVEAEAGIGMGWMIEGIEPSSGMYGRDWAGSGAGVNRRGRDWDRDRDRGGVGERGGGGKSYGSSSGVPLGTALEKMGCSGL